MVRTLSFLLFALNTISKGAFCQYIGSPLIYNHRGRQEKILRGIREVVVEKFGMISISTHPLVSLFEFLPFSVVKKPWSTTYYSKGAFCQNIGSPLIYNHRGKAREKYLEEYREAVVESSE